MNDPQSMQEALAQHDPWIPDAGNEAQADQRAQMEHGEQLKQILRKIVVNDRNFTPWNRALYVTEIVHLCQACGIDIREVT